MKSRVVAITALPKSLSLVNRDKHLNERAYQRALARNKSQSDQVSPVYFELVFEPSDDISLQQMTKEKSSRQRVVEMQNQLNDCSHHNAELLMH